MILHAYLICSVSTVSIRTIMTSSLSSMFVHLVPWHTFHLPLPMSVSTCTLVLHPPYWPLTAVSRHITCLVPTAGTMTAAWLFWLWGAPLPASSAPATYFIVASSHYAILGHGIVLPLWLLLKSQPAPTEYLRVVLPDPLCILIQVRHQPTVVYSSFGAQLFQNHTFLELREPAQVFLSSCTF